MLCFLVWLILGNAEVMWRHYSLPSCWVKQKCVFSGSLWRESYRRISVATTYRLPVHGWAARVSLCNGRVRSSSSTASHKKSPTWTLVALPPLSESELIWVLWACFVRMIVCQYIPFSHQIRFAAAHVARHDPSALSQWHCFDEPGSWGSGTTSLAIDACCCVCPFFWLREDVGSLAGSFLARSGVWLGWECLGILTFREFVGT